MRALERLAAAGAVAVVLAFAAQPAAAQVYYTINGQPAPPNVAYYMASNGLPFGNYWLDQRSGYWGVVGNPNPVGNIYAGANQRSGSSTWTDCYANGCASGNTRTGSAVITDGHGGAAVTPPGGHMIFTPN
jgi:hypothetical protein